MLESTELETSPQLRQKNWQPSVTPAKGGANGRSIE